MQAYIYIYVEREREREMSYFGCTEAGVSHSFGLHLLSPRVPACGGMDEVLPFPLIQEKGGDCVSTWESKVPNWSRYAPSICRGICREACSPTLARGRAQPNAEATLLVWLSTVMGDCRGKNPCRKNFRKDGALSCPYAGCAGGGHA